MAKGFQDTDNICREIVADVRRGVFKPVYLLMGDEPYYVDMVLMSQKEISTRPFAMERMSMRRL